MIERTRRYLAQLARDNQQVMIPSVVIGEYLHGFPAGEYDEQLQALTRGFFIPSFDARCAALAAEMQGVG
jgi:hypothetical protein